METATAEIGHNKPPSDIEILRDRLAEENAKLISRAVDLIVAATRVPDEIDDGTAGRVGDFIKQLTGCMKALDEARKTEKEPFLSGGRTVDGYFKVHIDELGGVKANTQERLNVYMRAKADAERRAREEAERLAREEAERAAAQVADDETLDQAVAAEEVLKKAEQAADANAAELSRTRGDYGAVASLRTTWVGEMVSRDDLDLEALRPHLPEAALAQAIRSLVKAGGRELRGARIYERQDAVVR